MVRYVILCYSPISLINLSPPLFWGRRGKKGRVELLHPEAVFSRDFEVQEFCNHAFLGILDEDDPFPGSRKSGNVADGAFVAFDKEFAVLAGLFLHAALLTSLRMS